MCVRGARRGSAFRSRRGLRTAGLAPAEWSGGCPSCFTRLLTKSESQPVASDRGSGKTPSALINVPSPPSVTVSTRPGSVIAFCPGVTHGGRKLSGVSLLPESHLWGDTPLLCRPTLTTPMGVMKVVATVTAVAVVTVVTVRMAVVT